MSSYASDLWSILTSYRPNPRRAQPVRFGTFEATYLPAGYGVRRPRTDREAQRLYNHIRTVAFWLDAAPLLSDLGLPFRVSHAFPLTELTGKAGLDDIISLVPLYGDIVSGILQLYQVWLCFVFGVPLQILGYMLFNVIADVLVGIVPLIGDFLDNLFKSNLRNLALLETWLLTDPSAQMYHILLMPESNDFVPKPKSATRFSTSWFGGGSSTAEDAERERERETGKIRATRRMGRDEGEVKEGKGTRSRADPVHEPVD